MIYKVLKKYPRFYLAISKNGYKECFDINEYNPDTNGLITKKRDISSLDSHYLHYHSHNKNK